MTFLPKFPKLIHQIWIGDDNPPKEFKKYTESWKKYHPTWQFIFWDSMSFEAAPFQLINQKLFDFATNLGIKSDILRYEILYKFGGLYVDMDFECYKPIDPLLKNVRKDVFAASEGKTPTYPNSVANAIIGALPNSLFLEQVLKELPKNFKKHYTNKNDPDFVETVSKSCGPAFLTSLYRKYPQSLHVFERRKFYPHPEEPNGKAFARHHYSGLWK